MIIALEVIFFPLSLLLIDLAFPLDNQWPLKQQKTVAQTTLMVTQSGPLAGYRQHLDRSYVSAPEPYGGTTPGYFSTKLDRGMLEQTSELSSRPEEMTYCPTSPLTNQLPTWPQAPYPQCLVIFVLYDL